jgi:lysyl-tRNA synthetase class 2
MIFKCLALEENSPVEVSARVVGYRRMGNVSFGHIQDSTGKIQFCLKKNAMENPEDYKPLSKSITNGGFVRLTGKIWFSSTGEKTVLVSSGELLSRPHTPPPSSFYGISDEEALIRKRYLHTALDTSAAETFVLRSRVISIIREFLTSIDFIEVETPILSRQASGAMARPFVTHHNALDRDFYLRIAPETYLKMMTAGGFNRVFEIGKSFRNEGIDRSHVQEFTSLEWYLAFADYQTNKHLFVSLINQIVHSVGFENGVVNRGDLKLDFFDIRTKKYRDLFGEYGLESPDTYSTKEADELFKRVIRPNIIQPTFVEDYPAHMSPMAARKKDDPNTVEQWQLIADGWEIVKCYTELVDPTIQRELLEQQAAERESGNDEAMMLDEAFLEAMEYGMPPQSGLGMGIDRLICILTDKKSLRDVIYFPMLR